jgi:hypothetical protein
MSSAQSPSDRDASISQSYFLVPGYTETTVEVNLGNRSWMAATVIEDDDLMFGGKPLCTWYEEERREEMERQSHGGHHEEQTRGRTRERPRTEHHYDDGANHQDPRHHIHKTEASSQ